MSTLLQHALRMHFIWELIQKTAIENAVAIAAVANASPHPGFSVENKWYGQKFFTPPTMPT